MLIVIKMKSKGVSKKKGKVNKKNDFNLKEYNIMVMENTSEIKERSLTWYKNRVKVLRAKPQPVQKSKEWFAARNTRITASEASCCIPKIKEVTLTYEKLFNVNFNKYDATKNLSIYDTKEDYIINKCRTFYGENLFNDNKYTLHGKKYEEISCRLYRIVYNTPVIEFGLLPHPRLNWLAASPDGIDPNGIMLEIKNPSKMYTKPSITYFTQTQIQMETADLDFCDFLVCDVKEFDSEQEFIDKVLDTTINETSLFPAQKQFKGIVLNKVDLSDNNIDKYIYPPDNLITVDDFINWANESIEENKQNGIKVISNYYIINEWSVIRIKRNKEWFNLIKPYLKETIDLIRKLQSNRELFEAHRKEVHQRKSKTHFDNFNNAVCLFDDLNTPNDNFVIHRSDENDDIYSNNSEEEPVLDKKSLTICLIDD
jgi:hypothetical protein